MAKRGTKRKTAGRRNRPSTRADEAARVEIAGRTLEAALRRRVAERPSAALRAARARHVEAVASLPPALGQFRALTARRAPEPATHADPRMHLTLDDMTDTTPAWPGGVKQRLPLVRIAS